MLDFVARVFRGWMNFVLWLVLIVFIVGGFIGFGILFSGYRESFNISFALLGLLVGGVVGLITVILSGGLIANFLNMVDNIEYIAANTKDISNGSSTSNSSPSSSGSSVIPTRVNTGATWTCKKCNEVNPNTAQICKSCGEYK